MKVNKARQEAILNTFNPPDIRPCHNRVNLTGRRFGRLIVYSVHSRSSERLLWLALCDCGLWKTASSNRLLSGVTKSCGCLKQTRLAELRFKHGMGRTPEYRAYGGAKNRCENPQCPKYPNYGGRGIQFRFASFEEFYAVLGDRPSPQHSIDRIDVNGHYESGNVRWATAKEQQNNKSSNVRVTAWESSQTLTEWADQFGVEARTVRDRLARGWTPEQALTVPTSVYSKGMSRKKWAELKDQNA